jgi:hypothetical protein
MVYNCENVLQIVHRVVTIIPVGFGRQTPTGEPHDDRRAHETMRHRALLKKNFDADLLREIVRPAQRIISHTGRIFK